MLAVRDAWKGVDQEGYYSSALLDLSSTFYDWCYDWLVTNGHDQYVRDNIKAEYWSVTPTRLSSQFAYNVREGDLHNYTSWPEAAVLNAGLALFNDDALGATILNEGPDI